MTDRDNVLAMSRFFIMLCGRLNIAAHFETIIALCDPIILLAKNLQDKEFEDVARHWQLIALENWKRASLDNAEGQAIPQCSFCGKAEPDVRLAVGAGGHICDSCVGILGRAFESETPSRQIT